MSLRTFQVAHQRGFSINSVTVLFTVPAGHTLLLKDLRVAWGSGAGNRVVVGVRKGTQQVGIFDQVVQPAAVAGGPLGVVLEEGDELYANVPAAAGVDASGAGVVASGALLVGSVE